jgi:hypothetical protein
MRENRLERLQIRVNIANDEVPHGRSGLGRRLIHQGSLFHGIENGVDDPSRREL